MKKRWLIITIPLIMVLGCFLNKQMVGAKGQDLPTAKFAVTINVKSKKYGAKNRKDCTKAFQKALNEASKRGSGRKQSRIIIPKGTYYLKGTLLIGSNVFIDCKPGAKIIKKSSKFAYMIRSKFSNKGKYSNVHNVLIKGGIWNANFKKYTSTVGGSNMCFVHANNIVFRDVTICNNYATHLIEFVGVRNGTIENSKLYGYKTYSDEVKKEAIQLDIAHSSDVVSKGYPYDDTPCSNIIVRNNEIFNYARGIGTHSSVRGIYSNHILIEGNSIHNMSAEAVYLYNFTDVLIQNNRMKKVGKGVLIKSSGPNLFQRRSYVEEMPLPNNDYRIRIFNNKIVANNLGGSKGPYIGIHVVGEEMRKIAGIAIDQNRIYCMGDMSIYMKNVMNSMPLSNVLDRIVKIK